MKSPAALLAVLTGLLAAETHAVDAPNPSPELRTNEYGDLSSCINFGIPQSSGLKVAQVAVDKPDFVLCFLSNGAVFYCQQEVLGTKGTYWKGVYEVQLAAKDP